MMPNNNNHFTLILGLVEKTQFSKYAVPAQKAAQTKKHLHK
tara:strand:- start:5731 stop:5853 length:123 start_codon:yes stop_codon:yes gene_type:complete